MFRLVIIFLIIPYFASAQYCNSNATLILNSEIIEDVQIGNIITQSPQCAIYTDNTALQMPTFQPGDNIPIQIYTQVCNLNWWNFQFWTDLYYDRACKIFMDWNNDGDFFDVGETVYTSAEIANDWTITFNADVTVPTNVQCTNVRTRSVYARLGTTFQFATSIQPCGIYPYGETEDYIIPIGSCFNIDAGIDQSICEDDTTTLNPQIVSGATYSWSPNSNISNINISNPSVYPSSTTTYVLTVDSSGFISSDSVIVSVSPNPVISLSQDQTICNGATPSDISVTNISGATYSWTPTTFLSNPIGNQTSFNSSLTNSITYSVNVSSGVCNSIDSVQINVNPIPTAIITATPNPACIGDDIQLLANTSIPVIRYRFQFNNSNTWQNITTINPGGWGTTNPVIFNNITTTTQFRVRVREDWGCTTGPWSPIVTVPISNITVPPIIHN